jgi:hypothetical protein
MPKTYSLIQAQTLTSTAASVTFSNIPQNYTDLKLMVSSRDTYAGAHLDVFLQLSGITTSVYTYLRVVGNGSTVTSSTGTDVKAPIAIHTGSTATANSFANYEIYIPNYTSASNKSFSSDIVSEQNATLAYTATYSAIMANTSAVTSIKIFGETAFAIGSTFYLYGIGGTRASGGTITSDKDFTYHTFTSTSTFTALERIKNAEVLVVAGGGASTGTILNGYATAGGGAGGLVYSSGQTFFAGTSYTALVGAGGAAGASGNSARGGNGGDSQFGSVTRAVGGGAGGAQPESPSLRAGAAGGSGGGSFLAVGGAGTAGQGNAGGNAAGDHPYLTSGGGGAGEIGGVGGADRTSGKGGNGSSSYTQWGLATGTGENVGGVYYYAGGGAGGLMQVTSTLSSAGGFGGGGSNTTSANGKTNGTANTGGGASGVNGYAAATAGASGGSGIVIIRYPNV